MSRVDGRWTGEEQFRFFLPWTTGLGKKGDLESGVP